MNDDKVRSALRSDARMVAIEAPAGCGKTHQGAEYARETAGDGRAGRPLILTHTHAACSVFAERTKDLRTRVEIRTIDSVIGRIAATYHVGLRLPADIPGWLRQRGERGHQELALRVGRLLARRPMISAALARRYPVVICDEHQDSSGDQHAIVMALLERGARVRIFADPMQKIFRTTSLSGSCPPCDWDTITAGAHAFEKLDYPHRWDKGCPELGRWTLKARELLKAGRKIDLGGDLPPSVSVVYAESNAQAPLDYRLDAKDRKPIDRFQRAQDSLLVLTRYNETAFSLRGFFGRVIPLWEGYTRPGLDKLVEAINAASGDSAVLASAVVTFMGRIGKGFSPSEFGNRLEREVREGCVKRCRGKPALIQKLAKCLLEDPSHRGVATMLEYLLDLKDREGAFAKIEMDCRKEFLDAIRLGGFATAESGLAELMHRRTYLRPKPTNRAISTIHKAKGLECDSVIVMPCNKQTFPDKDEARALLYVALSRAKSHLMLVVSRYSPSPLLIV